MENTKKLEEKLDRLSELLEASLILQGKIAGIANQELRAIVGVGMDRVTKITKYIKEPKTNEPKKK